MTGGTHVYDPRGWARGVETAAAWLLGILWLLPLVYAFWTAFHPAEFSTRFVLSAPLTLDNFAKAWAAAPFARYFLNTVILCTMVLAESFLPFALIRQTLKNIYGSEQMAAASTVSANKPVKALDTL